MAFECYEYISQRHMDARSHHRYKNILDREVPPISSMRFRTSWRHPVTAIENCLGNRGVHRPTCVTDVDPDSNGRMGLERIDRRRIFELSFFMLFPDPILAPKEDWESGKMATITTSMASSSHFYRRKAIGLPGKIPHKEAIEIMGLPDDSPMTCKEIGLSVPPEYCQVYRIRSTQANQTRTERSGSPIRLNLKLSKEPTMHVTPILYFDLETQLSAADVGGWENAEDMRVSVACAYDSAEWHFYEEHTIGDLIAQIRKAALVIGFNLKAFDYKVLSRYTDLDFGQIPTFDMLDELYQQLGHRVSLDNLAQATLGIEKTGDGLEAIQWWREGRIAELRAYCQHDVDITRKALSSLGGRTATFATYTTKDGQVTEINTESWKEKVKGLILGV